jgi:single-strand DNA-binding protein
MLNQCILVGRILENPKLAKLEDGRSKTEVKLSIKRAYKNEDSGDSEEDVIQCTLWSGIAESTVEYCKSGATIGIKARLISREVILQNGETLVYPEVMAEKVTFIKSKEPKD